jgi:hypothetical protein
LLNAHYPNLKNTFVFTREALNRVLSAKAGTCIASNELSLYMAKFTTECPYSNQRRFVSFYFRQVNGKPPSDPKCAQDVTDTIAKTNQLQKGCIRVGRNIEHRDLAATGVEGHRSPAVTINTVTPKRKVRTNDHGCAAASAITPGNDDGRVNEIGYLVGSDVGGEVGCQVGSVVGSNVGSSLPLYWDSPEAAKLFGFSYQDGDDVHKGVQDIVTSLTRAQQSHDGYKHFVANIDRAPLTPIQIFRLKSQCLYLRTAYQIALTKLGRGNNTWIETCCGGAVRKLSTLGFNATVDKKRLGLWNRLFRRDHIFPHPNSYVANGMKPKPRIFEVFPEAEAMISDFVLSHLDHFSVAMLRNELITIIIPGLKQKAEDESVPVDSEEYLLLSHLSTQPPSYSTVLRWLHYLGYTHDKLRKSYYVDGHEHQEQKLHRSKFIKKYLELEIRTHRWVQMSIVEFEEAQSSLSDDGNDKIINPGYSYTHAVTGDPWIEFHVDDINMKLIGDKVGPFGGNVSVRCPAGSRPLIIFGQDESIFNQFSHSGRQWLGPLGQRSIMPKSAGMGIMLSAFQSRDVSARIVDCCYHIFNRP